MSEGAPSLVERGHQILEVTRNTDAYALLWNFHLDLPVAHSGTEGYLIEVAGWAVGRGSPVVAVDIGGEGPRVNARIGVPRPDVAAAFADDGIGEDCGFRATVAVAGLPPEFQLSVRVHTADGQVVTIAEIVGQHDGGRSRPRPAVIAPRHTPRPPPTDFDTTVDGRLPSLLARTTTPPDAVISPADRMSSPDVAGYLGVGESALKAVRLALLAARAASPERILDFGCGHGRVLRWLRAAYPDAQLTASDLLPEAVDFCVEQFGATGVYSTLLPTVDMFEGAYDLIWVGSVFTHLDVRRWDDFLALLHGLLAPAGVLVMTVHGELVAERMRRGAHYGYPEPAVERALSDYDADGFAYLVAESVVDYGLSVSKPSWVLDRVLRFADLRVASYTEALWANHQDVLALVRRPVLPDSANSPYT